MRRWGPVLAFTAVAFAVAIGVFALAYRANLNQLHSNGSVQLEQASDRLLGQLAPFQQLPNLLARHPQIVGVLQDRGQQQAANAFLANTALTVGADAIYVLDDAGTVVGASDYERPYSELGNNAGQTGYVRRAMSGGLGFQRGLDPRTGARDFFFARGVIDGTAPPVGAVVVRVDVAQLEFEWEGDDAVLAFFDASNIVFVTNRVELRLTYGGTDPAHPEREAFYAGAVIADFPATRAGQAVGDGITLARNTRVLPARALMLSKYMPRINMTAQIYLETRDAARNARVLGYLALAIMGVIGAGLLALGQRRRRLADRLQVEAAANAQLEARVEERTAQLRQAQNQLVQAGKLTALGQMSAGISHEVSQPLAAIRNFAANGVKLIERDREAEASANLTLITEQVDRINRIIKNLRGFARNEVEVVEPVDLMAVLADAARLMERRLAQDGVTLQMPPPGQAPLLVMGGPVRLQQVIVNLMTNAADAMAESTVRLLTLEVEQSGAEVCLRVADTGPGLADPDRVFEPFYTTKDVGASKGLGLGLSISYGIIGTFGGSLSCCNRPGPEGGAEFLVKLKVPE